MIKGKKETVQSKSTLLDGASSFDDVRICNFRIRPRTINEYI